MFCMHAGWVLWNENKCMFVSLHVGAETQTQAPCKNNKYS